MAPYESDVKYLGTKITEDLGWNIPIKTICSNLNKAFFILKILKERVNYKVFSSIYYFYFQTRLKYGIMFWGLVKESIMVFQKQNIDVINRMGEQKNVLQKHIPLI
jgi:hypothetical protein